MPNSTYALETRVSRRLRYMHMCMYNMCMYMHLYLCLYLTGGARIAARGADAARPPPLLQSSESSRSTVGSSSSHSLFGISPTVEVGDERELRRGGPVAPGA